MQRGLGLGVGVGVLFLTAAAAWATPDFVEHIAGDQVYDEPAGVTMREPNVPREGEAVDIWIRIGYSFYYDSVAVYYTTDGSEPTGTRGVPSGSTSTMVWTGGNGNVYFIRNEPHSPNNIDWWKATLPAATRNYGTTVKYKISAWHSGGGDEVFANQYGCSGGGCTGATVFPYTVKLAWPGIGYPPVSFWKEEGVVGNNVLNVQLDMNGTVYDLYYPSVGCRYGMGTRNEGYVDGLDTFPPGLPPGYRGQMNMNQGMGGLRVDGVTYWFSNENGYGYGYVTQEYITDTNVIHTSMTLLANGNNIQVNQYDFCPKGITFPNDDGGTPNRGLYVKRVLLTNNGGAAKDVNFYFYSDPALNGGDIYDSAFTDAPRGTMVAYDNTDRYTSQSGEYNPTTTGDYHKNVSIYLATAMKLCPSIGGAGGTPATDFWSDTSGDQDRGWIGLRVHLPVGVAQEIDVIYVGGFDGFAGAAGTYGYQIDGPIDWFLAGNMYTAQTTTETYWRSWLAQGTTIDTPDDDDDALFNRGLLGTALHLDGEKGGLIAGMHNGAYPFIWPRDAVYGAITFDRTGHTFEASEVHRFLRDVAYRAYDVWGKGFWYQKYTTDGYIVWNSPQVDETSAVPWGVYYHYLVTGDTTFLNNNYAMVYEAARASSEDSTIDGRLYYDDPYALMHGNNVWEDSWGDFIYSNASVVRGLRDAAVIAGILGHTADQALFNDRANAIQGGVEARLDWNGENCDISLLGITYPFEVVPANHARAQVVLDRINGGATPLVYSGGEFDGLVKRYWGDTYWNGGPWFLSTAWYGLFYAVRQDLNPGKADIDKHKQRLDLLIDRLGPIGFGAEQIAPSNSLLYPGQPDYVLQTAWPNAWESMSTLVDALMIFLDFVPDAPANTLRIEPKLPTGWSTMTFNNLKLGGHRANVTCSEGATYHQNVFTNVTGSALDFDTYVRVPAGKTIFAVTRNGTATAYTYDTPTGRVHVPGALSTGAGATTEVRVYYGTRGDANGDGYITLADYASFPTCMTGPNHGPVTPSCAVLDFEPDNDVDEADFAAFQRVFAD